MAYPIWPLVLDNPVSPLGYERILPLATASISVLGQFTTRRKQTRDIFKVTGSLQLIPEDFQTFFTFWRDTLFNGKAKFTAPWITDIGHPEYVAKIPTYSVGNDGVHPLVRLNIELVPDVKLDPTNTFPDPWQRP